MRSLLEVLFKRYDENAVARAVAKSMCYQRRHFESHLPDYCSTECVTEALRWVKAVDAAKRKVRS